MLHTAHAAAFSAFVLALAGCARAERIEDVAAAMPDRMGAFRAEGETRRTTSGEHVVFVRRYVAAGREATMRAIPITPRDRLGRAFETSLSLRTDALDELARPTAIDGERAALSWSRATGESTLEILVAGRVLLALAVWPANAPDEAERLFPRELVEVARDVAGAR